jgi:hypothetical protein
MRDFDLLQGSCRGSGVHEQTRVPPIHGGAEAGDFTRGRSAWRDCERGLPASRFIALGAISRRAVAQGGSTVALKRDAQRTPRKDDAEARYKAEIERMRAVIAEITAENLELKKRSEAYGFIPCTGGHQGSGDADRRAYEETLGVASVSHACRPGRAAQRVLRLEGAARAWKTVPASRAGCTRYCLRNARRSVTLPWAIQRSATGN